MHLHTHSTHSPLTFIYVEKGWENVLTATAMHQTIHLHHFVWQTNSLYSLAHSKAYTASRMERMRVSCKLVLYRIKCVQSNDSDTWYQITNILNSFDANKRMNRLYFSHTSAQSFWMRETDSVQSSNQLNTQTTVSFLDKFRQWVISF